MRKIDHAVTKKVVRALAGGATIPEIAKHFAISVRTVKRVRASKKDTKVKRGRPLRERIPYSFKIRRPPSENIDPGLINDVYNCLIRVPFPYPEPLTREKFVRELERIRSKIVFTKGDEIHPQSYFGIRLCTPFFPNRYRATWKRDISAFEGWRDETALKHAIRLQLRYGDPVTPGRVLRALTLRCRTPTVFRPAVAKFVYQNYCPAGGIAWDPCAGYGGRLLGAFAVGVRYIGTDVDQETVDGNRRLAEALGANYDVVMAPAETFTPPTVDLVFTSPPYFDRERYSHGENQTWKKHGKSFETWLDGFLRPVIERAHGALRAGGHLVLNVANLKEGDAVIPIVSETIKIALASNLVHVKTLLMPLAAINRVKPAEPILVFKKH